MKELTEVRICMTHRHRLQGGEGQREEGRAGGGEPRGEKRDICNSVNNENKIKIFILQ